MSNYAPKDLGEEEEAVKEDRRDATDSDVEWGLRLQNIAF